MVQFNVSFSTASSPDLGTLNTAEQQAVLDTVTAACQIWSWYLGPVSTTLDVGIRIDNSLYSGSTLAVGGAGGYFSTGAFDDGARVYDSVAGFKLKSGSDPNGSSTDLRVGLTVDAIRNKLYFNPDVLNLDAAPNASNIPSGRCDALSVMLHEIGHGLGFSAFSDALSDSEFATDRSLYETFIDPDGSGKPIFTGANAVAAVSSGNITLEPDSMAHFMDSGSYGSDLLSTSIPTRTIVHISLLDSAVLRDLGLPTRLATSGNDIMHAFFGVALFMGDGNDSGFALSSGSMVSGEGGNDTLYSGVGNDTLNGGDGTDTANYQNATSGVTVSLASSGAQSVGGGQGSDTLISVESIKGSDHDDSLTGDSGSNSLIGGSGNDMLNGGTGADFMYGGAGGDTFYVDTQGDLVFENVGEGFDTVFTTASFYMYDDIEQLQLVSGAGDIFGSGNSSDNMMVGNEGGNLILGWDGNDTISGLAGNDILYGVNGMDTLYGNSGTDYLIAGDDADTLEGGEDADALYGENGNDTLYGGTGFFTDILVGGAGNDMLDGSASPLGGARNAGDYDLLYGGTGDDTYYVDTPADLTFEDAGEGTDIVFADIVGGGYYLYANVENLTLLGVTPFGVGNGLDNVLTGSAATNWLLGGAGNDTLNGKGGNDVLFGEAGADIFVFEPVTGGDVIGDFSVVEDKIRLLNTGFSTFDQMTAANALFESGGSSVLNLTAGDFVVINGATGLTNQNFLFA